MPVLCLALVPSPSKIYIRQESDGVKGTDDEEGWNNFKPEIEYDSTDKCSDENERLFEFCVVEPDEVKCLSYKEDGKTDFRGVVNG